MYVISLKLLSPVHAKDDWTWWSSSYLFHGYQDGTDKPIELANIKQQNGRKKSVKTKK